MDDPTALLRFDPSADTTDPVTMVCVSFLSQFMNRNTRAAYTTDLKIYFGWCTQVGIHPLRAKRAHLQAFALHLAEGRGNGAASVCRRIGTITGWYATAVLDDIIEL